MKDIILLYNVFKKKHFERKIDKKRDELLLLRVKHKQIKDKLMQEIDL